MGDVEAEGQKRDKEEGSSCCCWVIFRSPEWAFSWPAGLLAWRFTVGRVSTHTALIQCTLLHLFTWLFNCSFCFFIGYLQSTGTRITVYSVCCPRSTDRIVQILGKPSDCAECIKQIIALVKEVYHPSSIAASIVCVYVCVCVLPWRRNQYHADIDSRFVTSCSFFCLTRFTPITSLLCNIIWLNWNYLN